MSYNIALENVLRATVIVFDCRGKVGSCLAKVYTRIVKQALGATYNTVINTYSDL